jgi:hypothetical protein
MLDFLKSKASARKLQLFACACCRLVWHLLIDQRSREAVEAAERRADGVASDNEIEAAFVAACNASFDVRRPLDGMSETMLNVRRRRGAYKLWTAAFMAAFTAGKGAADVLANIRATECPLVEKTTQSGILRDLFGNPFSDLSNNSGWGTPAVLYLAEDIYENRVFDRMPELASALEQANCTNYDVLNHCRWPLPHVRGCWVVDRVLGRK